MLKRDVMKEFSPYKTGLEKLGQAAERAANGQVLPATVGDRLSILSYKLLDLVESVPDRYAAHQLEKTLRQQEAGRPLTASQIGRLASQGISLQFNPLRPVR